MIEGFIPPHGGYRKLLSYQRSEIVYDATVRFCARFFGKRDRQAATKPHSTPGDRKR